MRIKLQSKLLKKQNNRVMQLKIKNHNTIKIILKLSSHLIENHRDMD